MPLKCHWTGLIRNLSYSSGFSVVSGNPEKTWGCRAHHLGAAITARNLSLKKTHLFERESHASLQAILEGSKERKQVPKWLQLYPALWLCKCKADIK